MSTVANHLLGGRYLPVTAHCGYVRGPCEAVAHAFASWKASIGSKAIQIPASGHIADLLALLTPVSAWPWKFLWVSTRSEWSALFINRFRVGDCKSAIGVLAKDNGWCGVTLDAQPDGTDLGLPAHTLYGSTSVAVYDPSRMIGLGPSRMVQVANDGGKWTHNQFGDPLAHELGLGSGRRIRERFTSQHLDEYLRALGIRWVDDDYYLASAWLIEFPAEAEFTENALLAEARDVLGYASQ